MKFILFLISACYIFITSCNKQQQVQNVVIDTTIDIFIENNKGENLLSKTTANAINIDSLRLIYPINGKNFTVYNSNMDCPTSICYNNEAGKEWVRIFPNVEDNQEEPITYIKWGNNDIDTLKCHIIRNTENSNVICSKVWYNGVLMFPNNAIKEFGRAFKVVK